MSDPQRNANGSIADTPSQAAPAFDPAARAGLKAAFSPDTPEDIRERVLDAVFAVLNGDDDD